MTKIALLIPTIDAIGGAERQVLLLAAELARSSHSVTLIALSGHGGVERQRLLDAGVSFLALEMRKAWLDPRGCNRYLVWARRERPEILHAHLPHASWFARWVRLLCPVRVLVDTIHTSSAGGWGRRLGYRFSDWLSNHVTCVSEAVSNVVAAEGMASGNRLSVLPNGVVVAEMKPHRSPEDAVFHWIAVGRLAPVKDYATLLRAFALLGEAQLTIAGTGPEEGALRKMSAALGVDGRVHFAGFQSEMDGLLPCADGFVLSSLWEGLPVSVLEAQAAGLPVVATDGPGTCEALLNGITGWVVPVGDAMALANAMRAMMAMSHDERRAVGVRGREFVRKRFSLPVVVALWLGLYERLLKEHPIARRYGGR